MSHCVRTQHGSRDPQADCDLCGGTAAYFNTSDEPKEQPVPNELEKDSLARHERDRALDKVEVNFPITKYELLQVARFWMKGAFEEGAFCAELGIPSWRRDLHPNERVDLISKILAQEILDEAWREVEKEFDKSENDPIEHAKRAMQKLVDEMKELVEQFGKPLDSNQNDSPGKKPAISVRMAAPVVASSDKQESRTGDA